MSLIDALDVVVGAVGVAMGASSLLQLYRIRCRRSSNDVSIGMLLVLVVGAALWLLYGLAHGLPVVVIANAVGLTSSAATLWAALAYRGSDSAAG